MANLVEELNWGRTKYFEIDHKIQDQIHYLWIEMNAIFYRSYD